MTDILTALRDFEEHCQQTEQEQVAELAHNAATEIEGLREALRGVMDRDMRNTCQHEETHRGGAMWEICNGCGAMWADDEGGKPEWQDPPEWTKAYKALATHGKEKT